MSDTKGKVNLLDTVPVQCGHITTEWEGEYAILSFPRFKYDWMRRFLLPKSMSADIHVKLEEHGTAVWRLIGTFIKYYKISQLIHTQSIAN